MKFAGTVFLTALVFCTFALGPRVEAQSASFTFTALQLTSYGKPGDRVACHAEVKNLTGQKITLNISRTRNDIPATWMSSFCLNQCYAPFTDNATEDIAANVTLPFTMYFDTDPSAEGSGVVEIILSAGADPNENYTLQFTAITSNATGAPVAARPVQMSLKQNYPNPFGQASASKSLSTAIDFTLNKSTNVTLTVFDMLGRRVKSLVNAYQSQGSHHVVWDGTNDNGQAETAGIYLYKLETASWSKTNRMILLR